MIIMMIIVALRCDHLMMFEIDYPEETTQYVFGSGVDQELIYNTISNRVYLVFCHSNTNNGAQKQFRIDFNITGIYINMALQPFILWYNMLYSILWYSILWYSILWYSMLWYSILWYSIL